jgi:hypothetical protein
MLQNEPNECKNSTNENKKNLDSIGEDFLKIVQMERAEQKGGGGCS